MKFRSRFTGVCKTNFFVLSNCLSVFGERTCGLWTQVKVSCERGFMVEHLTFVCTDLVRGRTELFFI